MKVLACIDGFRNVEAISDYAAWVSRALSLPVEVFHVLDKSEFPISYNLSGNLAPEGRNHLLKALAYLDQQRSKLALQQGKLQLQTACERIKAQGIADVQSLQQHGCLVDSIQDRCADSRVLIMGRRGEENNPASAIGSHLESVIRTIEKPILVTLESFKQPERVMLAYDASPSAKRMLSTLQNLNLGIELEYHLVMVSNGNESELECLKKAEAKLVQAGISVMIHTLLGPCVEALVAFEQSHHIDLVVMGAYGHSRIRQFFVGSTTTHMLQQTKAPILLVR